MRLTIPLLFASLLAVGCFDGHGRGGDAGPGAGDPDAGGQWCDCCGTRVFWHTDCAVGACDGICNIPDSGPPGSSCRLREPSALDLICPSAVRAGQRTQIPVAIGGRGQCFCGEEVECAARLGTEPFVLEIDSAICRDTGLCDGCFPYVEGSCALPPLGEGRWTVRSNGEDLFLLDVIGADVMPEWGLECSHRRGEDTLMCGVGWPPNEPTQANAICHPTAALADTRVTLTVTDSCSTCGRFPGPCDVEIFDDVLRVRASKVDTLCDVDCPSVCMEQLHTCVTPPLPAGTWRVQLGDIEVGTEIFVPGPGAPLPEPDEVCAGLLGG